MSAYMYEKECFMTNNIQKWTEFTSAHLIMSYLEPKERVNVYKNLTKYYNFTPVTTNWRSNWIQYVS